MAIGFLDRDVADLCLGKPPLLSLSSSTTVAAAITALKATSSDGSSISVWTCDHSSTTKSSISAPRDECVCVGKLCMADVILYLCRPENLASPASALNSPVSFLLSKTKNLVRHVNRTCRLLEAMNLMVQGAQNLVIPMERKQAHKSFLPTAHNGGQEFCWLTQEDVIRFLLSSVALFSPIPALSVATLGAISSDFQSVHHHHPASSATGRIAQSLANQTSVAVIDAQRTLIGEISPSTLSCCDEAAAAAVVTLSAGSLMAYIDYGRPPEEIVAHVEALLKERGLDDMLEVFFDQFDEESVPARRNRRSYSAGRMEEAIVCRPGSSLMAAMMQALAHRTNYVWVVEEDEGSRVVGIVTFSNVLEVFRKKMDSMMAY